MRTLVKLDAVLSSGDHWQEVQAARKALVKRLESVMEQG